MSRASVRLGLIGFGEVGFNIALGLAGEGLGRDGVGSIVALDTGNPDRFRARAAEAGVTPVPTPAELAAAADLVLGLTPGSACAASAEALAPHLGPRHAFIDLASATPAIKRAAATTLAPSGAALADGSIMGGPLLDRHRVEILASGPAAPAVHAALAPWGMDVRVVGPELGAASAIKIFRSVIAKGLEALLVECLLATERQGITAEVLASYSRFLAPQPFSDMAAFLVRTDVIHAGRRAEEAAMAAEALRDAGVEPVMTAATVARLGGVAALNLREAFGNQVPARYQDAVAAIDAGLAAQE